MHTAPIETELLKDHLPIVEHLVRDANNDGSPRRPGALWVTTVGSAWLAEALDQDGARHIVVLSHSLDVALAQLAELLRGPSPPWSPCKCRREK